MSFILSVYYSLDSVNIMIMPMLTLYRDLATMQRHMLAAYPRLLGGAHGRKIKDRGVDILSKTGGRYP